MSRKLVFVAILFILIVVSAVAFVVNFPFETSPRGGVKVGAYYYIWWGIPFNNHWNRDIKYTPFLGKYDSNDPTITDQHILLAKQHGIDFFAVSWIGKGDWINWDFDDIDQNLRDGILKAPHLQDFSFCLFYETKIILDNAKQKFAEIFVEDIVYAAQNYFTNPNYLRVADGKPVLFIYNLPCLYQNLPQSEVRELFDCTRQQLLSMNISVYLVGDVGGGPSPNNVDPTSLYSINATTSYLFSDASKGWDAILEDAEAYYPEWRSEMNSKEIKFIPNAYPGYNNTGLEDVHKPVVLPPNETKFKEMLTTAMNYADNDLKIVMVTSWNEWLESTAIEPSMELGELFLHAIYDVSP
jgi:hypothetical protein